MRYRILVAAALALVLLAAPAHAEYFVWGQEICAVDSDPDGLAFQPWQGYTATKPTNSTTTFGDATNSCSLRFSDTDGSTAVAVTRNASFSAEATICAMMWIRVDTVPTTVGARRQVFEFADSSSNPTGLMTVESTDSGKAVIRTWYENTGNECRTSLNDGTECTVTEDDCVDAGRGEYECGTSHYSATTEMDLSTWYVVGMEQNNNATGAGNVGTQLYFGEVGSAFEFCGATRPQGVCAGGSNVDNACGADSDCPGSTCTVTDVKTVSEFTLGPADTGTGEIEYYVDNIVVVDSACSAAIANYRVVAMRPNGEGPITAWGRSGCSVNNDNLCVDDVVPDGEDTYIGNQSNPPKLEELALDAFDEVDTPCSTTCPDSGVPCSTNADCMSSTPTIPAVMTVGSWKDHGDGDGADTLTITATFTDGTDDAVTTVFDPQEATNPSCGSTPFLPCYQVGGYHIDETDVTAGAWDASDLDTLEISHLYDDGDCTSNCTVRVSSHVVEALARMPVHDPVDVLPDNIGGGDGETVGFIGNSRIDTVNVQGEFDCIVEANNIYDCALGGATIGDFVEDIDNIKDGINSGFLKCNGIRKGVTGKPLDVAVTMFGVNTLKSGLWAPPSALVNCYDNSDCANGTCRSQVCGVPYCAGSSGNALCDDNSDCSYCTEGQEGYCENPGQSDHGDPCYCPENKEWLSDEGATGQTSYCVTGGSSFGDPCDSSSECSCSGNSDCRSRNQCTGGSVCSTSTFGAYLDCGIGGTSMSSYCLPGCLSAPGCGGVCAAGNSMARAELGYKEAVDTLLTNGADVVLVTTPSAIPNPNPLQYLPLPGCWHFMNPALGALNSWLEEYSKTDADLHFVDAAAHMEQCCPDGRIQNCLDDGIHLNSVGGACLGRLIMDCLENTYGTSNGTCTKPVTAGTCVTTVCTTGKVGQTCSVDGDCDLNLCTQGKISNECATDADCNTYNCAFVGATNYLNDANCQGAYLFDTTDLGLDSCGGDDPMTDGGTPVRDTGDSMQGASSFDGNSGNNYLICDSNVDCTNVDFRGKSAITTCGWAKIPTLGGWRTIAAQGWNDGTREPHFLYSQENGEKILGAIGDGAGLEEELGATSVTADTWYHACNVYDGANVTVYLNGEQDCSSTCTAQTGTLDAATDAGSVWIGARGNTATTPKDWHKEHLDEVLFFDRALGATEICEICRFGADGTETDRGATCGSCTLP